MVCDRDTFTIFSYISKKSGLLRVTDYIFVGLQISNLLISTT
jgi:hypothetical protein